MHIFVLFSALVTLAAIFAYINVRFIKLPGGISLMMMGTIASVILVIIGFSSPSFAELVRSELQLIDFSEFVLGILLSFLLFAGSLHVNYDQLKSSATSIISFATIGTIISTFAIGTIVYYLLQLFSFEVPYIYCLLFGSLISPTDPIAVMGILKEAKLNPSIQIKITGESLFNDGIAVVIFATLLELSVKGMENFSASSVLILFVQEAFGGIIMGYIIGYIGFYMMRKIDHFQTEILISLAMVMGGYSLCHFLHVSGPLAMVVAGLHTGNKGKRLAMSDVTKDYLDKFWEVSDEILNALLFMLIGLELIVVDFKFKFALLGVLVAALLVGVRYLSLWLPARTLRFKEKLEDNTLAIMTWGGLRGGISVALALSIPPNEYKDTFVTITFVIVLISILVQGFTIGKFIKRLQTKRTLQKQKEN